MKTTSKEENPGLYNGPGLQIVYTPKSFLEPARRVFTKSGQFSYDLAASEPNVCDVFFGEDVDSLTIDWNQLFESDTEPAFLNPPFSKSDKFLNKCSTEANLGAKVVALVQAAVGCSYWHKHSLIWGNPFCRVIFLDGRVPFVTPKWVLDLNDKAKDYKGNGSKNDCVIIDWSPEHVNLKPNERVLVWDWRKPGALPTEAWF